jgi:hypothetical protein
MEIICKGWGIYFLQDGVPQVDDSVRLISDDRRP